MSVELKILAKKEYLPAAVSTTGATAQVLVVDDDPPATEFLRELLHQRSHKVLTARSNHEAWSLLEHHALVDLVILDLDLDGDNDWELLERIRADLLFSRLPVLIYTDQTDRDTVIKVLRTGVQNFLLKPYQTEKVYFEVEKALEVDWIGKFFEDPVQVCKRLGISLGEYYGKLQDTVHAIDAYLPKLQNSLIEDNFTERTEAMRVLSFMGTEFGLSILKNIVIDFSIYAVQSDKAEALMLISRLISLKKFLEDKINALPQDLRQKIQALQDASVPEIGGQLLTERRVSLRRLLSREKSDISEPQTISSEEITSAIMDIKKFPVFDSILTAFKLTTKQMDLSVEDVVYLIQKDTGLCAQVLTFANSAYIAPKSPVDSIEMAIQLIGLRRLQIFALTLKSGIDVNKLFTAFDWQSFWMHQVGCALLSHDVLELLEAPPMPLAHLGGLLHDIGKILITHLYPLKYNEAVGCAIKEDISLLEIERRFFSITHEEAAALFIEYNNLPGPLGMVAAHHSDPTRAETDVELTALISLSNFLCKKYKVGFSGAPSPGPNSLMHEQPGWKILKEWSNSSCTPEFFENTISIRIKRLKLDLSILAPQLA